MIEQGRVLVVEDEPDVLLLCRVNLEFEGFEVVEASQGADALALARAHRPDVILLDVMMPRMGGWEVLRELKQDADLAAVPVVMLAARVQDADQIRAWEEGAVDYLTKPFSPLALSQVLQDVLATSPQEHERRRRRILAHLRGRRGS